MKIITILLAALVFSGCAEPQTTDLKVSAAEVSEVSETEWFDPQFSMGKYDCHILAQTTMATTHHENAGPPMAFAANEPSFWFGIEIWSESKDLFFIKEISTEKRPINQQELEFGTTPSVLMETYKYSGLEFEASTRPDFFMFYGSSEPYKFWQAGYIYPGGEDMQYVTRAGDCYNR